MLSLLLKLKGFKNKYLPGTYTTRGCIMLYARALFCSLQSNVPGTFSTQQIKWNQLQWEFLHEDNLLDEGGWLLQCVHLHMFFPYMKHNSYKKPPPPYTNFYMSLYSSFCWVIGITFTTHPVFVLKINLDDGTLKHILSHLT